MDKNPEVSVSVNGKTISMTTEEHKELNKENLRETIDEVLAKKDGISEAVGENWFPCGFAHLHIDGRSDFVRWMKKNGRENRNGDYELADIRISKDDYAGGYRIYLDYNGSGPTEQQSLNFKRPLYSLFQDLLGYMGVRTELRTRLD